jgi:hypothetical protein
VTPSELTLSVSNPVARLTSKPRCAFCGGGRAVRARVLPAWLDACFPDDNPVAAERTLACRACNRGWLAELERAARPTLEPMILGLPVVLALQNQETVALWSAKTVMALQAVRDPGLLPATAARRLYAEQRPPAFRLAVALRPREGRWPYRFTARGSAATLREWDVEPTFPDAELDHYRAELCIGHLVIQAGANFTPHARPLEYGGPSLEIWPARAPVRFPPASGLMRVA